MPGGVNESHDVENVLSMTELHPGQPSTSILYANTEDTVFVIDIPRSIAEAQNLHGRPDTSRQILSCPALLTPFPSTEPKSAKARAKVLERLNQDEASVHLHQEYANLVGKALKSLELGEWRANQAFCLPRTTSPACEPTGAAKRKVEEAAEPAHSLLRNTATLPFRPPLSDAQTTLPPLYTVLLGSINTSPTTLTTFHTACLSHRTAELGQFPLIILDPPWPNKSVSRSSSYTTSPSLFELVSILQALGLNQHMTSDGYVACWVTNADAVRTAVVGTGGLFEAWGVGLVEEWVWCKVTAKGEPVTELTGIWRKPYEVCLIGRRCQRSRAEMGEGDVKRRLFLGVPDLHSRKPCLKALVERLLPSSEIRDGAESRCIALELYARYAVAGWMSWGLEAVKYNHEDWWVDVESSLEQNK